MRSLVTISRALSDSLARAKFGEPVTHVYDPTRHARRAHEAYVSRARRDIDVLLLGMNPGPWGMVQTGVPFGEVAHVRDFLGIDETVDPPAQEHPKRPVQGFNCPRSEVSGRRLWSWVEETFGTADAFFERFFVWNWCPLAFMEVSGRNRTPDKLPAGERRLLEAACDDALGRVVDVIRPRRVIGVGAFATKRARSALEGRNLEIGTVLHPSPASPAANRGWARQADAQFKAMGVVLGVASASA